MTLFDNFKNSDFWKKTLQLATVFFLLFIGISLIISHFKQIVSGNFETIYQEEWANGQWVNYFLIKAAISLVYAVYMTSRRKNFQPKNQ
jgi:predicted tellurium resistance membrane protein TerC